MKAYILFLFLSLCVCVKQNSFYWRKFIEIWGERITCLRENSFEGIWEEIIYNSSKFIRIFDVITYTVVTRVIALSFHSSHQGPCSRLRCSPGLLSSDYGTPRGLLSIGFGTPQELISFDFGSPWELSSLIAVFPEGCFPLTIMLPKECFLLAMMLPKGCSPLAVALTDAHSLNWDLHILWLGSSMGLLTCSYTCSSELITPGHGACTLY